MISRSQKEETFDLCRLHCRNALFHTAHAEKRIVVEYEYLTVGRHSQIKLYSVAEISCRYECRKRILGQSAAVKSSVRVVGALQIHIRAVGNSRHYHKDIADRKND